MEVQNESLKMVDEGKVHFTLTDVEDGMWFLCHPYKNCLSANLVESLSQDILYNQIQIWKSLQRNSLTSLIMSLTLVSFRRWFPIDF